MAFAQPQSRYAMGGAREASRRILGLMEGIAIGEKSGFLSTSADMALVGRWNGLYGIPLSDAAIINK